MTAPVRVGIIGTGFGSQVVAPGYAAVAGCEVVDVVNPRDEEAVVKLCGRSDLDLVSVHSPPFLHLEHVRLATDAGHAVLCDKPFGVTAADAATMVELARTAGVLGFLNFERRYDPTRAKLRELLLAGAIGTPNHFQYSRFIAVPQPRPYGWLSDRSRGGGWLAGQGSHLIDATRWLFGEVVDASAVLWMPVTERPDADGVPHACDAEDGFTAVLRTESGVTSVIDSAIESPVNLPERTVVVGSTGVLEIEDTRVTHRDASGATTSYDIDLQGVPQLLLSMRRFAAVVCDAVRTGEAPVGTPTFTDGLACAQLMDRMGRQQRL